MKANTAYSTAVAAPNSSMKPRSRMPNGFQMSRTKPKTKDEIERHAGDEPERGKLMRRQMQLVFQKKLIGMSIKPPDGEPNAKSTIRTPR